MRKERTLNIITQGYPYGYGEHFFELEVRELAKKFDKIILFPLNNNGPCRNVSGNVEINLSLIAENRNQTRKIDFIRNSFIIAKIVLGEFRKSNQKRSIVGNLKELISKIVQTIALSKLFYKQINFSNSNYYYSFWMNDGALLLSLLKSKNKIDDFYFRVNGYDIFNERHKGNYLPFRKFNYKHVKHVFVLSNGALDYLKNLNLYPNKLKLAHYGIELKGLNPLNELSDTVRVVSCSGLIPLKRVDKIIDSLALIENRKVEWIHFGDGPLMDELKERVIRHLPQNVKVHFKGNVPNVELIEMYRNQSVNLFIHTSETEGLGMSIIEAQSFGIPAVVLGVGGVVDIVTNDTGRILHEDSSNIEIKDAIIAVLDSDLNKQEARQKIQDKCFSVFDANDNYQMIYELLTEHHE